MLHKLILTGLGLGLAGVAEASGNNWQLGLDEPVTPIAKQLFAFHNQILLPITVVITLFVLFLLVVVCYRFSEKRNPVPSKTTHHTWLEVAWTVIPALILVAIFIPSMKTLYFSDDVGKADMTLKITAYQWYWSYEYPDNDGIKFDSYMVPEGDLADNEKHLFRMKVDNPVVVPVGKKIKLLITANDVIHAWAMAGNFGVNMYAIPGRLNETWMQIDKPGTYYGYCNQLCGVNHSYMPIEVKAVSEEDYAAWLIEAKTKFAGNPQLFVASRN